MPHFVRVLASLGLATLCGTGCATHAQGVAPASVVLEGAAPTQQQGSTGEDRKAGSAYGHVLGMNWGAHAGDYAEYAFAEAGPVAPTLPMLRYARAQTGTVRLRVSLDGKPAGDVAAASTGGWGDTADQFRTVLLALPALAAGPHRLRLTVPKLAGPNVPVGAGPQTLAPVLILDLVGNRTDKNTVGHGRNVALYTGMPSQFYYATQNMTDVFSAADGQTLRWFPDYVLVTSQGDPTGATGNVNVDRLEIGVGTPPPPAEVSKDTTFEQRQVCVTQDDVVVSRIFVTNLGAAPVTHRIAVRGDCRQSADFRAGPGGEKATRHLGDFVLLTDRNVFPGKLPEGLSMAVGGTLSPSRTDVGTPGAYELEYDLLVPPGQTKSAVFACAFDRNAARATVNLRAVLQQAGPPAQNRRDW